MHTKRYSYRTRHHGWLSRRLNGAGVAGTPGAGVAGTLGAGVAGVAAGGVVGGFGAGSASGASFAGSVSSPLAGSASSTSSVAGADSSTSSFADVKVVTFDSEKLAREYRSKFDLDWPLLLNPNRELYRSYTMGKATWWALASPHRIIRYLADIFSGSIPSKKGKDIRQLGGDIVIDPQGNIRLFHSSQNPHDRPSTIEILDLVIRGNV